MSVSTSGLVKHCGAVAYLPGGYAILMGRTSISGADRVNQRGVIAPSQIETGFLLRKAVRFSTERGQSRAAGVLLCE